MNQQETTTRNILTVKNLRVEMTLMRGVLPAVRGIDLAINEGEVFGIVGESGCGKSTAVYALGRLLPEYAVISAEEINIAGIDITQPAKEKLYQIRGSKITYIFQDPQASLNPVMKIKQQLIEAIETKQPGLPATEYYRTAYALLESVKIKDPDTWLESYPHQLSGGMKQRVMIAIALANRPAILIADEPTTSLDVTVQSEILNLLKELNESQKMTIVFITHDLSVAQKFCHRIAVMYAGKIVEIDTAENIAHRPRHPYTASLWQSIPRIDKSIEKLNVIPGIVPNPLNLPTGCKFHPRCFKAQAMCADNEPELKEQEDNQVACYFPES